MRIALIAVAGAVILSGCGSTTKSDYEKDHSRSDTFLQYGTRIEQRRNGK